MADTEQGGTPDPQPIDADGGTAAQGTDGATTVDWEAKYREDESKFKQGLLEKQHLEEERQRRRELEAELDRVRTSGYGTAPATAGSPYAEEAVKMQQAYYDIQQSDDPAHIILRAAIQNQAQIQATLQFNSEMSSIPPAEQRAVAERARRDGISPTLALKVINGERWDSEKSEIETRRRKLDEEEEARKRGRVDTTTTPIPARSVNSADMTPQEYEDLCLRAERGDSSARSRLADVDEGRTRIKYG